MVHVLYLVHDLTDAAVKRRIEMLVAGGARVTLGGFRREDRNAPAIEGCAPAIDLGVTRNGKFPQRIGAVASAAMSLRNRLVGVDQPDIIMARNLEMLALADRAASMFPARPAIVYESLDIHRLLLGKSTVGRAMRGTERHFARYAQLLVTSSPAFVREYFDAYGQVNAPVALVENKVLMPEGDGQIAERVAPPTACRPWRIGLFGALRCARSIRLLAQFANQMQGGVEIVLRGRPAYDAIPDFDRIVADTPDLFFEGAYRNPQDLAAIYGDIHFNWTIDFFEQGMNSEWLLPNRLYEGGLHGAVPIARQGTETARFLTERGIGIVLEDCTPDSLAWVFSSLNAATFAAHRAAVDAVPMATWVHDEDDCHAFVARLRALKPAGAAIELGVAA